MTAAAWRWKPSASSHLPSTSKTVIGGQPIPGVGVSLDREVVEPVAQIEVRVEDQVVEGYIANIHGRRSFVARA